MVNVPYWGGTNLQHLPMLVVAFFELLEVQFAGQGDAYWSEPPFLQCFNHSHYLIPVERLFSSVDYRKQRRDKTLAYAQVLQDWVEKASINPSSRGMSQCVTEMWRKMYGLMNFTLTFMWCQCQSQRLHQRCLNQRRKAGLPMGRRGKGPREMHAASASEGTAAPTPPNAQGVKPPPGFRPKPEDPESQP